MATQRVQVFTPKRVSENSAQETHRGEEGTGAAIQGANYLPNIYQDGQDKGGQSGQQGNNEQLVQFLGGANTQQLRTLAGNVRRPTFSPHSPMAFIGPNATPAAFSRMSAAEISRRENWGDFRPGGATQAKFSPLNGMPISFDPGDRPITASVPREVLAPSTSVPSEMDWQVRSQMTTARMNQGNPRLDRLQVYNIAGVSLKA